MNSAGIVDVHSHYVPRGWPQLPGGPDGLRLEIRSERDAMIMLGTHEFRRISDDAWDPQVRLADMDDDDVAVQVLSPTPVFFSYDADPSVASKIARIFNELALEITSASPRLVPFCQVPLQDIDAACAELERSLADGHVGVEIGNHVGDQDLDAGGIRTFLQHCARLGVPVFVHPWDMPQSPRLDRWMAQWLVGMPAETHLSMLALVLGGVFDDVSEDLRICFAHGGGSFAYWLGRMDNAWHQRPDVIATSEAPPSSYVGRFSVDSVVFRPESLRLLVDTLGVGSVMVGSDYPYPLGERPVGAVVDRSPFLDDEQRALIRRGNAERFLGVELPTLSSSSGRAAAPAG
ncbi:amidohydrolase family protein [Pseudonocardia alaniniphila]|uniref:2-amino-3-carboxymuconate-6-semialdehyde decarboxylase n=1 Tax=Pseudonocardia alaniniphila TaxID=75291 RepID=A0ABS9TT93_9PSEU|nr:amidohydrolase family protein [Pseudonocardia alaniniphila]MCH6171782.1 amidohydrolase [Pseudonocardia alaniniphila]